ncbi:MAG: hypothetical protein IJ736_04455 [Firmicutes bacterium]|nr:hypothetical protein [Bacillota bacterium]
MKKSIAIPLILLSSLFCSYTVSAQELSDYPTAGIILDGAACDISAIVSDDRAYIPLRSVSDILGGTTEWDSISKTAKITLNEKNVRYTLGDSNIKLIDEHIYIPLRNAADDLGIDIDFDPVSKTVLLSSLSKKKDSETAENGSLQKVSSSSSFAARLNAQISKDKNYTVSPLSVKYALAMAANGADKETAEEITKLLDISDLEKFNDEVSEYINEYKEENKKTSENSDEPQLSSEDFQKFTFNIANSVWYNTGEGDGENKFSDKFVKTVTDKYDGTAETVNNSNAVQKINSWCDEKTNHKIPSIISSSDFLACLTNAVYFKAGWADTFSESATKKDIFTDRNGNDKEIDFMNKSAERYSYYEDDELKMISLPYSGANMSMYIAMTSQENVDFEKYIDKMTSEKVVVSMPKFKTEYSVSLADSLRKMGLSKALDTSSPHFRDMFDQTDGERNAGISEVLHKTYIDVNEKGTEAAAVTAVMMLTSAIEREPEKIYYFKADKPFTYFIRDNSTGDILFIGEYAYAE